MSFSYGIVASAFLIAFWAFLGGLRGVAWTDAVQGVFMLLMAISALLWVNSYGFAEKSFIEEVSRLDGLLVVPNSIWTPLRFVSLTLPWFFFALTNPQVFQRLYIPRDRNALRRMVVLFGLFGLIYTVIVTLIGLELRTMAEIGLFPQIKDRDAVTPTLLTMMHPALGTAIALSIFAAAITTANSIVLTLSSIISRDLFGSERVWVGRAVALTIAIAIFAYSRPGYIIELCVLSSTILLCQLPLILGVFLFNTGSRIAGIGTLLAGFSVAVLLSFLKLTPLGIPASVWTFIVSFATFFTLSGLRR